MMNGNSRKNPAIIFDLGGVLLDWNPRYLYRKIFNGDEDKVEFFLKEICPQSWNMYQDTGYPTAKAIEERCLLFPQYSAEIHAYYERYLETVKGEIAGTVAILGELREAGYTLCALSNWSAETFGRVRGDYPFLKWFDQMVISGEVGLAKPDKAIFMLAAQRVGRAPADCLFIDDLQVNIDAAREYGFQTIQFTSPQELRRELVKKAILA
jgi:haloacid dehalogenase superfamily, subfamily IA, variant 3 with third motif having DD or ED